MLREKYLPNNQDEYRRKTLNTKLLSKMQRTKVKAIIENKKKHMIISNDVCKEQLITKSVKNYRELVSEKQAIMKVWNENKVLFETAIGLDGQRNSIIVVHELDDLVEVATKFCEQNGLSSAR